MKPFESISALNYWARGCVPCPAASGGWWALGGRSTPTGRELYHIGRSSTSDRLDAMDSRPGWPPEARGRFVWALPHDGSSYHTICHVHVEDR